MQNIGQKITQDNFRSHSQKVCLVLGLPHKAFNQLSDQLSLFVYVHKALHINGLRTKHKLK